MKLDDYKRIESTQLDYKEALETGKPKSWLKTVAAFANTNGGHILFGVTDKSHNPIGLSDAQATATKISELITSRIDPPVRFQLNQFESESPDRYCIDLAVASGPNYPYYYVHEKTREVYIRHGDRSELASVLELNNLVLKGSNITYDALPSRYGMSDVSFTLLAASFKKETGEDFDFGKDLFSMGLISDQDVVTNAGLLLCDQGYMRQSRIVCTRWKGSEKGSVDGDALDDQEFMGASLIMLLSNAEAFIRTNSRNPWTIRGMRREEKSDYPFKAVREVLVNAIMHRDYQNVGSEVHVDMYDDRMEIYSPGGMMNGSRIQDMDLNKVPSMRRNEILSDVFSRLNFMDRRGSGIQRILNSYVGFAEKPEFYSDEYSFMVTLPNRSEASSLQTKMSFDEEKSAAERKQSKKAQLSADTMQLLDEVEQRRELEEWLISKASGTFKNATIEKLTQLLMRYGYQYYFNRKTIAESFGITENAASRIIRKSLDCGIMRKEKNGTYFFMK